MRHTLVVAIVIFVAWLGPRGMDCHAQPSNLQFRHFEEGSPLNGNAVYVSAQDSQGYMWSGTYKGLYRYDGYNMKSFENEIGDLKLLSQGPIEKMIIDHKNCLWALVNGVGLISLDINAGKVFKKFQLKDLSLNYGLNNIMTSVAEDSDGNIWVTSRGDGIFRWQRNLDKLAKAAIEPVTSEKITDRDFETVTCDNKGEIWIGSTDFGLYKFNKKTDIMDWVPIPCLFRKNVVQIECYGNFLFINDKFDIIKMDVRTKSIDFLVRSAQDTSYFGCNSVMHDRSGLLWVATEKRGMLIFNDASKKWLKYNFDELNPHSLISNNIHSFFEDRTGNIWIGTSEGACLLTPKQRFVNSYTKTAQESKSLSAKHVKAIYEDAASNIWVGTYEGSLNKISADGQITSYPMTDTPKYINHQNIYAIYKRNNGNLLVSTLFGFKEFDVKNNRFIRTYRIDSSNDYVWDLLEDINGLIWLATNHDGLVIYDLAHGKRKEYLKNNYSIWRVFRDHDNIIWLGTNKGLIRTDFVNGNPKFIYYPYNGTDSHGLHGKNIFDIYEDPSGILWLATTEGGLNRFDKNNGTFEAITTQNGLTSNCICGILQDNEGLLWLSTQEGVCVWDPNLKKAKYFFNKNDGFLSDMFSFCSRFKNKQGKMYFGSNSGLNSFFPDDLKKSVLEAQTVPAQLAITSFKTLYHNFTNTIDSFPNISLPFNENTLFIDFALMDFANPVQNQFSYKLEGLDTSWYYADNHHYTTFTDLSPGKYVFLLKARTANGPWSTKLLKMNIEIRPPLLAYLVVSIVEFWLGDRYYCCVSQELYQRTGNKAETNKNRTGRLTGTIEPSFHFQFPHRARKLHCDG